MLASERPFAPLWPIPVDAYTQRLSTSPKSSAKNHPGWRPDAAGHSNRAAATLNSTDSDLSTSYYQTQTVLVPSSIRFSGRSRRDMAPSGAGLRMPRLRPARIASNSHSAPPNNMQCVSWSVPSTDGLPPATRRSDTIPYSYKIKKPSPDPWSREGSYRMPINGLINYFTTATSASSAVSG